MLKRNKEFNYIYRRGKTIGSRLLLLAYVPMRAQERTGEPKFGFSVSRKVGNSVTRNRIKRLLRECVRHHLDEFNPSFKYIFTARVPVKDASYSEVERAVLHLVGKAGLLNEEDRSGS